MSSFFDELMDEIGSPQLYSQLGGPVTHYPQGIIANAATVTAIWTPTSANEDMKRGRTNERSGTLQLADSVVVDSRDLWLIDSEMWSAGPWRTIPGGMKEATLKKPDQESRTPSHSGGKW